MVSMVVLQRGVLPFFLGFEEHGKGVSADNLSARSCLEDLEDIHPICRQFVTELYIPIFGQGSQLY